MCKHGASFAIVYLDCLLIERQAKAYYNLQDLHVGGFIIYTGSNPSAKMQSTFFTGSDAMTELAQLNNVAYSDVLNYLEIGLRYVISTRTYVYMKPSFIIA